MGAVAFNTAILIFFFFFIRKIYTYKIAQHLFYQPSGKPNAVFLINKSGFKKIYFSLDSNSWDFCWTLQNMKQKGQRV